MMAEKKTDRRNEMKFWRISITCAFGHLVIFRLPTRQQSGLWHQAITTPNQHNRQSSEIESLESPWWPTSQGGQLPESWPLYVQLYLSRCDLIQSQFFFLELPTWSTLFSMAEVSKILFHLLLLWYSTAGVRQWRILVDSKRLTEGGLQAPDY